MIMMIIMILLLLLLLMIIMIIIITTIIILMMRWMVRAGLRQTSPISGPGLSGARACREVSERSAARPRTAGEGEPMRQIEHRVRPRGSL